MKILDATNWLMMNERVTVACMFSYKLGYGKKINEARATHEDIRSFLNGYLGEFRGEQLFRQMATQVISSMCIKDPEVLDMPSHVTVAY